MNIRHFILSGALAGVAAFSGMARGQDAGGAPGGGAERGHRLDFLSREDKLHLLRVRRQVLESNPDLKAEGQSLRKEAQSERSGGATTDKAALRSSIRAHREKMDAAMVKADPTVQPILEQIKAHLKERFSGAGGDDAGTP